MESIPVVSTSISWQERLLLSQKKLCSLFVMFLLWAVGLYECFTISSWLSSFRLSAHYERKAKRCDANGVYRATV